MPLGARELGVLELGAECHLQPLIDEVKEVFPELPSVAEYLDGVLEDAVEHFPEILSSKDEEKKEVKEAVVEEAVVEVDVEE